MIDKQRQDELLKFINDEYQKEILKRITPIRDTIADWIKDEAADVYIARSYRASHGLPVLPRDSQKNKVLADGVVASKIAMSGDAFEFVIQNLAKPDPPLFNGTQGDEGDLSLWTIGGDNGKSFIHPLLNKGKSLDMTTFYDNDPYIEDAIKAHQKEIDDMINTAIIESVIHAVKQAQLKFK